MSGGRGQAWFLAAVLALSIVVLYAPVREHQFLEYDDGLYVLGNAHVLAGWTWETAAWALTSLEIGNWHPLTWWSHALTVEVFGLDAGAHHAVSVVIHAAAAGALLLTLYAATGSLGRSALVAALFGLHPLRLESVAWIAERKDVLFGLFFILALAAHVGWVRRPSAGRYLLVVGAVLAALASKAMAVSVPVVLLLLDRWPLRRTDSLGRRVFEKLPLFAMSALAAVAAIWAQDAGGALSSVEAWPWSHRLATSVVGYGAYLVDSFWPTGLAVFYPHPRNGFDLSTLFASGLVVAGLAVVGVRAFAHGSPVGVGLLWFLGTLLPVIGLITVGEQARADRYTYVPSIGLAIAAVWVLPDRWMASRAMWIAAGGVLAGLGLTTRLLLPHWQNDETLFAHALSVTSNSHVAHLNYGNAIEGNDRRDEQRHHFERAIALDPNDPLGHYDLGRILALSGDHDLAIEQYQLAIALDPEFERAWNNLGTSFSRLGKEDLAERAYEQALVVAPDHPASLFNLGILRVARGDLDAGLPLASRYLSLRPADHENRLRLASALVAQSRREAALEVLEEGPDLAAGGLRLLANLQWERGADGAAIAVAERGLGLDPGSAEWRNDLAWMLATSWDPALRDGVRALELARVAAAATERQDPDVLDTLAAALAATGEFDAAHQTVEDALERAREQGRLDLVPALEERVLVYRSRQPFVRARTESAEASP